MGGICVWSMYDVFGVNYRYVWGGNDILSGMGLCVVYVVCVVCGVSLCM